MDKGRTGSWGIARRSFYWRQELLLANGDEVADHARVFGEYLEMQRTQTNQMA